MSVKSGSSQGETGGGPVVRSGYLKKLKTSKKKYFVLRAETAESSARLEYYDSEKKFNSGQPPKRSIPLKTCFNINKRNDTKHKHVIALYTKDDCFCVVLENEEDLDTWLKGLLSHQQGEEAADGQAPRPTFEHVWQVTLLDRGLGATPLISGGYHKNTDAVYRLCLTDKTLSLIRKDCDTPQAELSLSSIRTCGSLKNFFFLEAGRASGIGAGELWMVAEDTNIAQNVHQTVFHAMKSNRDEMGPKARNRSSSATESSKPNNMARRQTLTGTPKPIPYQEDHTPNVSETPAPCTSTNNTTAGNVAWPGTVNHQRTRSLPLAHPAPITTDNPLHPPRAAKRSTNQSSKCLADCRARCDSMPSRPRTTSEGNHVWDRVTCILRPQSFLGRDISHSPPSGSPVSPPSAACSTDSAGSSLSIDESEPWHDADIHRSRFPTSLTPDEAIVEENCDDCTDSPCVLHSSPTPSSYVPMAPISSDDGYVDMSPRGRHTTMSPAASMSSVTSGTPSTDMRFAEYPLEKVNSYFTPSEDDETSSAERPRTYSMGSRPYKGIMGQNRDRAWSVGSKSKKGYNRVLPPHGPHAHHGTKSSSAPMLSNSRLHSSHSSIDPMDDLMELDFSKKASGYMEMKPGAKKAPPGYVEMRPGHIESTRPPDTTPYVDMRPGSSPAKPIYIQGDMARQDSYMDMDKRSSGSRSTMGLPISPMSSMSSTSPTSVISDYMDMRHKNSSCSHMCDFFAASPVKSTLCYPHHGSPSNIDYIDMDYGTSANSRYMEMSMAKSGDYVPMTSVKNSKKDRKPKKDANRSQPIMIQNAAPVQKPGARTSTPPKMYLPLHNSPYSSLPRQRSRKNSRRDSKDSSSSSITTPSSSSTIFPFSLNSPSSPIYPATTRSPAAKPKDSGDYAEMSFESTRSPVISEYVNFNPAQGLKKPNTAANTNSDYLLMTPGVPTDSVTSKLSTVSLGESSRCFKPIADEGSDSRDEGFDESSNKDVRGSRPSSVASDAKLSRPSSESSEVGSTTSTIVGSRPASVTGDGQIHYASLDLADEASKSPRAAPKPQYEPEDPNFPYAEIDFVRSEGLKTNSHLLNNLNYYTE